ncbi:MAG: class I SAM-dependent methyltransferase [Candidatus Hodarchaeota archaeon]
MDEFHKARLAWDKQFERGYFLHEPIQREMPRITQHLRIQGVHRVLDLGCGSGRHTAYLAKEGFAVFALDIAPSGLSATLRKLATERLTGYVLLADIRQLPFGAELFDAIISVRVIHHNRIALIHQTVEEMWRVLTPHGLVWVTVPVPKGHGSKHGLEIEPGTWVPHHGIEKGLPHHLFTEDELKELFHRFSILQLRVFETSHYSLIAQKPSE